MAGRGGARPGAGRKKKAESEELRALLDAAVSSDDWKQLFAVLISRGKAGDPNCAKLLMAYRFGMPIQRQEHTGENGDVIRIRVEYADIDPSETA